MSQAIFTSRTGRVATVASCLAWVVAVAPIGGCAGGSGGRRPTVDLAAVEPEAEAWGDDEIAHLQFVLNDEQQEEFLALPLTDRPAFLRVAWASLDPTPTTGTNERRDDHYRRLAVVRKEFARSKPPGFDQRGELLLRYGPPDQREKIPGDVVPGLGLVPPKEIWIYRWLEQAYQLEDGRFQGDFQDALGHRRTARVDVLRDVEGERDRSDPSAPTANVVGADDIAHLGADAESGPAFGTGRMRVVDAEAQMARERLQTMLERGQEGLDERPRAYFHDPGGEKLDYFFDVQCFSHDGTGRTRVEVNTALWAENLHFRSDGGVYLAVLDSEVVLKTSDYRPVERAKKRTPDRRASVDNLKGRLVVDRIALVADPGDYRLALSVRDSVSGDVGVFQTETTIPAFPPGEFAMSDIQPALDVESGQPDGPFAKGNLKVVPYPLGTFPRNRDIYLYFEVYGLTLSPTGDALYTVQFKLQPRATTTTSWFGSSKGRVVPGVATAYNGTSPSRNVQEYFSLDPSTFIEDVYDVEIVIRDRVSDREVTRSVAFAVQK